VDNFLNWFVFMKIFIEEPEIACPLEDTELPKGKNFYFHSTIEGAVKFRKFINRTLNQLPLNYAEDWVKLFTARLDDPTFFELISAKLFYIIGGEFEYEVALKSGKKPDFIADFDGEKVIIEARCVSSGLLNENSAIENIKRGVHRWLPKDGYWIVISSYPKRSGSDSVKDIVKHIKEAFVKIENGELFKMENFNISRTGLRFSITRTTGKSSVSSIKTCLYTREYLQMKLKNALERKSTQVKGSPLLKFLSLNLDFMYVDTDTEKVDECIFGFDGLFQPKRVTDGLYAGLLVFFNCNYGGYAREPVLYIHPNHKDKIPPKMLQLKHKYLENGIMVTKETQIPNMEDLFDFVRA
jgi:hypothetical protein